MYVKLCRDWRMYHRGDVIEIAAGVGTEMARRGICTVVDGAVEEDTKQVEIETATLAAPETTVKRKRGRPRKYPERYADGN